MLAKGALHHDALSRGHESDKDSEELSAVEQTEDSWCAKKIVNVQKNPKGYRGWKVVGSLLYYYNPHSKASISSEEEDEFD